MYSGADVLAELDDDALEELDDVTQMLDVVPAGEVLTPLQADALEALDDELIEDLIEVEQDDEIALEDVEMESLDEELAADTATELEAVELVEEIEAIEADDAVEAELVDALEVEELLEEAAAPAAPSPTPSAATATAASQPVAPVAAAAPRPPSGAHAMLGELTSFVEKLQEAAQTIARLEAENDDLRARLAKAEAAAAGASAVAGLNQQVRDLQGRLDKAEAALKSSEQGRAEAEAQSTGRQQELEALGAQTATAQRQLDGARKAAVAAHDAVVALQQALGR
jgi:flagellar biosynthesis chaperone FliJ